MSYVPATLRQGGFEFDASALSSRRPIPTEFGPFTIRDQRGLRLGAQHAISLGSQATAHLVAALPRKGDGATALLDELDAIRIGLSVEQIRAVGGDHWPACRVLEVPQ